MMLFSQIKKWCVAYLPSFSDCQPSHGSLELALLSQHDHGSSKIHSTQQEMHQTQAYGRETVFIPDNFFIFYISIYTPCGVELGWKSMVHVYSTLSGCL